MAWLRQGEIICLLMNYCYNPPVLSSAICWKTLIFYLYYQRIRRREIQISKLSTKQTGNLWGVMVFTILTLFCLTQNSGILNLLLKESSAQAMSATSFSGAGFSANSVLNSSSASNNMASHADAQAAGTELVKSEPKKCELSEKSIRTCIDTPSTIPFLILLFLLPLLPRASRVITLLPIQGYQAKPRRIHLTHCRFQE